MNKAELLYDVKALLGEGPIWHAEEKVLYFIDIEGHRLHSFSPEKGEGRVFNLSSKPGTVVPVYGGGLLLGVKEGIALFDKNTEEMKLLHRLDAEFPENRCNDGKCDPEGRFWVGTKDDYKRPPHGSLYCMDITGKVEKKLTGLTVPNGIAWDSAREKMYFIDTASMKVAAFDYEAEHGAISNKNYCINIADELGYPDGMTIDEEGNLWIGHFFGSKVTCWDPVKGKLLDVIEVPVKNVTACWFGGEDLSTLYITTARLHTSEEELKKYPHAGGVFTFRPGVRGRETSFYKGIQ